MRSRVKKPQAPEVPSAEWHLAKVVKVAKETVPDKPAEPNKPAEPSKPTEPTKPTELNKTPELTKPSPVKAVRQVSTETQPTNEKRLPQTGDEKDTKQRVLGTIMLAMVSFLGFTQLASFFKKRF